MLPNQTPLQNTLLFKAISKNKLCLRVCIAMPCLILWSIILFLYFSYNTIYVIPLISNTYWYDNNPNSQLTQDQFPVFKHIISMESKFLQLSKESRLNHAKKGWILFGIMHYLLFWFLVSIIRTMCTDPGRTPHPDAPWSTKIESLANFYLEQALQTLKNNKQRQANEFLKNGSLNLINEVNPSEICPGKLLGRKMLSEPARLMKIEEGQNNKLFEREVPNVEKSPPEIDHSSSGLLSEELSEREKEEMNKLALEIVMSRDIFRYCGFCKSFKPLRTHHCQQCMRCVMKMDHHCQWVLTCIGLRNYKFFMNMIIYATLILLFFLLTFTSCVMDVALNPYLEGFIIYVTLFSYILGFVLNLIVLIFTSFHFWLIYRGKTTLEYFEKVMKEKNNIKKKKKALIDYDQGFYANFVSIFNKNPLFWFFPLNPNSEIDGLFQEFENQLLEEKPT